MKIETERLIMRPFELEDAKALFAMESVPEVHTYLGKNHFTKEEQATKSIQYIQQQYEDNGIGRFAVILKESNELIGWSGLKLEKEIRAFNYYDVGYRFHPKAWGKGIASESAIASLKFGFEELHYPEICAAADIENIASNKVLQKIGMNQGEAFTFEGTLCNWYSLKIDEFRSMK